MTRFERILHGASSSDAALQKKLAGAVVAARAGQTFESERDRVQFEVAAGVAAPVLIMFVLWLLRQAESAGLKRLYFLARDGQILHAIAKRLQRQVGGSVDCRYLYASRQSWHLPALTELTRYDLDRIFEPTDFLSPTSLLARVELSPGEVSAWLRSHGIERNAWHSQLSPKQRARLKSTFEQSLAAGKVQQNARNARELLLAYLEQEEMLAGDRWALVDIGWRGTLQRGLGRILAESGFDPPVGFYFGLRDSPSSPNQGTMHAFYVDGRDRRVGRFPDDIIPMMEVFCRADHGLVMGFQRSDDGHVVPRCHDDSVEHLLSWGVEHVNRAILSVADSLTGMTLEMAEHDGGRLISTLLKAFWSHPSPDEAEIWGSFPYTTDQTASYRLPLARRPTHREMLGSLIKRRRFRPHGNAWVAGTYVLAPEWYQWLLRIIAKSSERRAIIE